jgi:hypothetical protein
MVRPGRIHVVDAFVDRMPDLADCPLFIDLSILEGQTHAPESQY